MSIAIGDANSPVFLTNVIGGGVSPPNVPTNLVATVNGLDIDLTWTDNATDEDGYKIYRSSDNIVFAEIDDIAAGSTSYTDLNPGAGVWYYYVAAYNLAGESDSNVANAFIGALDAIPNLVHLYDIARRWVSSYTGNLVRLRRNSDNAELDFSYVANGDLDVAAINTWLGGASGFIVTIYDQILGDHVTQATAGNQPLFVPSGQNGKPVMQTDGADDYLSGAVTLPSAPQAMSFALVMKAITTPAAGDAPFSFAGSSTRVSGIVIQENLGIQPFNNPKPTFSTVNYQMFTYVQTGAATGDAVYLNGNPETGTIHASSATNLYVSPIDIGRRSVGSLEMDCLIGSLVIAGAAWNTSSRQAVEAAINSYYAIF